ncbi:MAG TPA: protein phosphatase 2C domain-containing protein, partial [Minicystis sp.]|nr:protein phosphatase 2C domain-containing protein [Minicystis sp.]
MMQPFAAPDAKPLRLKIEFAQATDPGRDPNKQVNEDACGYAETRFGYLCVLCDGMGGHYGGKEASRTAITTIFEVIEQAPASATPAQAMKAAIEEAGRRVYRLGGTPENRARPGSTVVAMLLHDRGIDVAHVGDSRAYVIRQNQIYPLTRDHSMVQGMIDAGMLTEEQAMGHPDSNKITRALGMKPEVDVEVRPEPMELFPGDILISSSDGLTDLALGNDILGCARQALASGALQHACNMLVKMANDRGGHDNITVQMARVLEVGPKGATAVPMGPQAAAGAMGPQAAPNPGAHGAPGGVRPGAPSQPIQQPPTADWNPGRSVEQTDMGTEIMGPLPTLRDLAPRSTRPEHAAGGAPAQNGQPHAPGGAPQGGGVPTTQSFEAYRMDAGPASLPLPPRSNRGTALAAGGAAAHAAPFVPLSPSAAVD